MNDWLDYKGSGSARAYTDNGLMSDSNISHGFFGIQTKKEKSEMANKQKNADIRLLNAYKEKKEKLELELYKSERKLKELESDIKEADSLVETAQRDLSRVSTLESNEKSLPLYKEALNNANKYADRCRGRYKTLQNDISKIEDEIMTVTQKITPLELSLKQRAQ